MPNLGTLDLASGVGGKIEKDHVLSAVDKYEKYHVCYGGQEEERKSNYTDMVNKYYDLVTSFYEYGWGESFHFAPRWKGESLKESIKRHEHFLALQLVLKPGQKVLDVGCGIGGPLREIARFSSTSVTGLNNNEYQISRGQALNRMAGLDHTCNFVKVKALETLGVAPKGSQRVQAFLEKAAEGLVAGGKKEIFTSMYFFLARKPDLPTQ
ncbi:Cycloartenol-C-24-methyltransferase 1 [Sesamum angolense]|uniref:Cycloartenol-C-24-methyltransferase 1 n=1 Tax=Sesamum angolense TaxID=2727404 RepID=A0AAE2C6N6_9LAMI|nr:Cycloartenol-C-24-methyltransferase 1 [Sesamum angolense]